MYGRMELLLMIVASAVVISNAQSKCFVSYWYQQRGRMYAEDRAKSLCVDSPSSVRHPEQRIRLSPHNPRHHTTKDIVLNKTVQLWQGGVVPYTVSDQFSALQTARIAEAIEYFMADSCVNWKPRTKETDHVQFIPRGRGCMADVGRQGGAQTIILGEDKCFKEVGDVLQLMLHVLGFYHEHQRVDRDSWIRINFDNIPPEMHNQFVKIRTNLSAINDTPYDYASLTNYGISLDGRAIIEPKAYGFQPLMGQRRQFSHGDIDKLNRLYPCTKHTSTKTPNTTTGIGAAPNRCILLIGVFELDSAAPLVEYYHPTEPECDKDAIGMMSTEKINRTYLTSGCYLSDTQQIVIREASEKPPMLYGLRDSSAKQLPLPYRERSGLSAYTRLSTTASISPTMCLSCGGRNKTYALAECFQFDSSSPTEWTQIPSLSVKLSHSASVSVGNDSYYITGGYHHWGAYDGVSRYSVSERRWSYDETSMNETRHAHSAAALSSTEFIVCGGRCYRADCEVYNTIQKEWRRVGNLTIAREYFALVNFDGRVYAIGGIDSNRAQLDSVEEFDGRTEKWTMVKKLKHSRADFVAVVV